MKYFLITLLCSITTLHTIPGPICMGLGTLCYLKNVSDIAHTLCPGSCSECIQECNKCCSSCCTTCCSETEPITSQPRERELIRRFPAGAPVKRTNSESSSSFQSDEDGEDEYSSDASVVIHEKEPLIDSKSKGSFLKYLKAEK